MSTEDKVFAKHPISGVVARVRPIEAALFGMEVLKTNERTGKPVINKPKPAVEDAQVDKGKVTK